MSQLGNNPVRDDANLHSFEVNADNHIIYVRKQRPLLPKI